jgi:hypothetical protein
MAKMHATIQCAVMSSMDIQNTRFSRGRMLRLPCRPNTGAKTRTVSACSKPRTCVSMAGLHAVVSGAQRGAPALPHKHASRCLGRMSTAAALQPPLRALLAGHLCSNTCTCVEAVRPLRTRGSVSKRHADPVSLASFHHRKPTSSLPVTFLVCKDTPSG